MKTKLASDIVVGDVISWAGSKTGATATSDFDGEGFNIEWEPDYGAIKRAECFLAWPFDGLVNLHE